MLLPHGSHGAQHSSSSIRAWNAEHCLLSTAYLFSTSHQPTAQFIAKRWALEWGKRWDEPHPSLYNSMTLTGFQGFTLINIRWKFVSFRTRKATEPMLLDLLSKLLPTPVAGTLKLNIITRRIWFLHYLFNIHRSECWSKRVSETYFNTYINYKY